MVFLLPRPWRHYGKVQGCAALIDRRVSRDLGIGEVTRNYLFARSFDEQRGFYVILDAILSIQSVLELIVCN